MTEENDNLEEQLDGYKGAIDPTNKLTIELEKDLIFAARTQRGYVIDFDAKVEWGIMPTESLLASVAGCLSIDMVSFLRKMRCEISSFKIDVTGERNPTPPQYYTSIDMMVHIKGKGITTKKMDRVVSLSQEKYCSVYHTLRSDLKVTVNYDITAS